jgi:hypothetical protein
MQSNRYSAFIWRATPDPMMHRTLGVLLIVLCLQGCAESTEPVRRVHTSFSESSGLIVVDSTGLSQQLIEESLGVRVVVSPSGQWIVVENMQLSNLVVIRAFRYIDGGYREITLPEIRRHWKALARKAGITFEDLMHTRVGIEEFGSSENTVLLHFQADTGLKDKPEIDSIVEIRLDTVFK